jgi:hypothetical protein
MTSMAIVTHIGLFEAQHPQDIGDKVPDVPDTLASARSASSTFIIVFSKRDGEAKKGGVAEAREWSSATGPWNFKVSRAINDSPHLVNGALDPFISLETTAGNLCPHVAHPASAGTGNTN